MSIAVFLLSFLGRRIMGLFGLSLIIDSMLINKSDAIKNTTVQITYFFKNAYLFNPQEEQLGPSN